MRARFGTTDKKSNNFFLFYSVSYRRGNVPPSLSSNALPSIPVEKSEGRVGWSKESGSNNSDLYPSLSLGRSFGLLRGREGKKTTALRMPRKQFLMPHTSSARLHSERTARQTERENGGDRREGRGIAYFIAIRFRDRGGWERWEEGGLFDRASPLFPVVFTK